MLWQGLEHAMGVVSKKVDGPSGQSDKERGESSKERGVNDGNFH